MQKLASKMSNKMNNKEHNFIFGIRPIIEAINANKEIDKLFIQKGLHNELFSELWKLVRLKRINYKHVPIEKINRITRKNHQGVVAFMSPVEFQKIENIIPSLFEKGKIPLILVLDRITDVRNFGSIIRTSECAGVNAILFPEKKSAAINEDTSKTSSGAIYKIPLCRSWNLKDSLIFLKNSGIQIIACTEKTNNYIQEVDYSLPTAIIMGSEESGVSKEYLKISNLESSIPLFGEISSYNVAVATGIILYEVNRQRKLKI